ISSSRLKEPLLQRKEDVEEEIDEIMRQDIVKTMLIGIYHTSTQIIETNTEDFLVVNKVKMNRKGVIDPESNITEDYLFTFSEYAPSTMRRLRKFFEKHKRFNSLNDYSSSFKIEEELNLKQFSEGKSGSFFCITHDSRFFIKTLNSEELTNALRRSEEH